MNNKNKIYIIAEAGVNHNGKKKQAMDMVDAAVEFGANAIKFQTFQADLLVTKSAPKATYQKNFIQSDESQLRMLQDLELSNNDFKEIYDYCAFKKIDFLSTAFDSSSLSFLSNTLKINKFKIPSGELSNAPFILEHALLGKDLIVSTGMSTLKDIEIALGVIAFGLKNSKDKPSLKKFGEAYNSKSGKNMLKKKVTLLHCTTAYPAPIDEVNLSAMIGLKDKFKINVGFSDHTKGILASIVASSLGANIIEKHFTLDKNQEGPDHKASI